MTPLEAYLAQVKEREEKATSGPWAEEAASSPRMIHSETDLWDCGEYGMKPSWIANVGSHYTEQEKSRVKANADFIARARTDVPTLVRLVEVLMEGMEVRHARFCPNRFSPKSPCECVLPAEFDAAIAAALEGKKG